jgi:predicted TIM-barrel fold metal-dependent hydrolase
LPDIDGSLAELSYALDVLKLDGVVLFSNARGVYLGDERLDAVFEELERRRVVVFVHPTASPDRVAHALGLPDSLVDFVADTTRAIAHLHYSNTFARTPNVKYIFSHAGGTIPYLATRFGVVDEMGVIDGAGERGTAADTLRRLYWDTARPGTIPSCSSSGRSSESIGFFTVLTTRTCGAISRLAVVSTSLEPRH